MNYTPKIGLMAFFIFLSCLSKAQTPVKIHDLKTLTDSTGVEHLFYRIYETYEGTDYLLDNIYHFNTQTRSDTLFLESFYDRRLGFPFNQAIRDYKFLNNDPENFVYITTYCFQECEDTISRSDSIDIMGGPFVFMDHLIVEGTDSGRVYIEVNEQIIIGQNGGRDWPVISEKNEFTPPDSTVLDFPLISLSPFNDSLMFGIKLYHSHRENAFLRSIDQGKTHEIISDTLLPKNIYYDSDLSTVYLIDRMNAPGATCPNGVCKDGIYRSTTSGTKSSWSILNSYKVEINILPHPSKSGTLYFWNADYILKSIDYGNSFKLIVDPEEVITGFSTSSTIEYFSTISTLYKIENNHAVDLISIPVATEHQFELPQKTVLLQNYPNPFNPTTTIKYIMKADGMVALDLYTIQGQRVRTLLNEYKNAGQYTFRLDGSDLSSGIYILRGRLGLQTESRTITLIK